MYWPSPIEFGPFVLTPRRAACGTVAEALERLTADEALVLVLEDLQRRSVS